MKTNVSIMLPCVVVVLLATFIGKKAFNSHSNDVDALLMQNIESLSSPPEAPWEGKKLKQVDCTCTNGKSGTTLKCRTDGDLEKCTATQQGSNACYKVTFSGLKLCI
jgi:hypothetical protein